MIFDIQSKRAENLQRLSGESAYTFTPYTLIDCSENPLIDWDIISILTRFETVEYKNSKGEIKTRKGKNLAYPDLIDVVNVGERKRNKYHDSRITRTNISTMRGMLEMRSKCGDFYEDETDEQFLNYFENLSSELDSYAKKVVLMMIESDSEFLNRVNAVREDMFKKRREQYEK